ncbi:hypothetical protein [Mesobacillus sp. S13]|nr:hypothetical protein [Mesobacillus sp. S13]
MEKVLDTGIYCSRCKLYLNEEKLIDWECWCAAEEWKQAKVKIEIDEE